MILVARYCQIRQAHSVVIPAVTSVTAALVDAGTMTLRSSLGVLLGAFTNEMIEFRSSTVDMQRGDVLEVISTGWVCRT